MRILAFVFFSTIAFAQDRTKLDSLQLLVQTTDEDTVKIKALLEISRQYNTNNYKLAAKYAQDARELSSKKNLTHWEAASNRSLGNVFFMMGDYKSSSQYYYLALNQYEEKADTTGIVTMLVNLGAINDRLLDYDQALSFFLKGQALLNTAVSIRPQDKARMLPTVYNNIGNIYQIKKDIPSGMQYYEKALAYARQADNKIVEGIALNNMGKVYFADLNQPEKAKEYLELGLKVRKEVGDKSEISKSYIQLSGYYTKLKNFKEARAAASEALRFAQEVGALETQKEAFQSLSIIDEALGNYSESLRSYKEYKRLADTVQHQLVGSEITRLQLQYDFEKADKARIEEREKLRLRYITIIVVLSAFLLVAMLITIIVRSRARQTELKRKNLAQDVDIKNKELTTNVMYLIRKNELINSVAERLLKLEKTALPENQKTIRDIIVDLQREADSEGWKEFELRFNQVHSEFYKNLHKLYPGLSPADEKLCAFLRLNMSSKEIAAITQQSIKSVEVARARLRKKLNLTNTNSNLVTHLANL